MNCLTPVVRSRKTYKHVNGKPVPVKTEYYLCGCGKCVPCMLAEQRDWAFRLMLEAEVNDTAFFITLTFNDENLPEDNCVHPNDVQRFMNSLRKKLERICKSKGICVPKLSYFAVGEYGRKENRPHYHIMLYNFPIHRVFDMYRVVCDLWNRGFVKVEFCTPKTCNYVCKYMMKLDPRKHDVPPFRLMSRRPAIGYRYFMEHGDVLEFMNRPETSTLHFRDGKSYRIPRSIRRKFFRIDKLEYCREMCKVDLDFLVYHSEDLKKQVASGHLKNEELKKRVESKFFNR